MARRSPIVSTLLSPRPFGERLCSPLSLGEGLNGPGLIGTGIVTAPTVPPCRQVGGRVHDAENLQRQMENVLYQMSTLSIRRDYKCV